MKLEEMPLQTKSWRLSFDFKLYDSANGDYENLLYIGIYDRLRKKEYGERNPAINVHPLSSRLKFTSSVNGNYLYVVSTSINLPLNVYHNIKIKQTLDKYNFSIELNGELLHSVENTNAQEFHNVSIYSGHGFLPAAKAFIKNLIYQNQPDL